jgi:hypothetical protein
VAAMGTIGADGDGVKVRHQASTVIASLVKQSMGGVDCFVASLLAMR